MEIPFIGGAYEGRSKSINAQRSINIFPVYDDKEAKTIKAMYGTPGTIEFSDPEYGDYEIRAMVEMGGYLYITVRDRIFKVNSSGTAVAVDSDPWDYDLSTTSGHVRMVANDTQVLVVDGSATGRIVTSSSIASIGTGQNFSTVSDCAFFDGYFIAVLKDSDQFQICTNYNGLLWDALDFATAEAQPDNLVGIGTTKQNVWFFGTSTTEVYFDSGNADFPFERVPGAVIDIGCGAIGSIASTKGALYWLTNTGQVVRSKGYSYEVISTGTIEYQIASYTTTSDAQGFCYELEGRTFYVLSFPTAEKTWVVDIFTKDWHEWNSGSTLFRGTCSERFNGKMLVGSRDDGKVYELDLDTYTDAGETITRVRRTQIINKENVNVLHRKIELDFEPGVGLDVESEVAGYDPEADLTWSDDDGNTWATTVSLSMGKYEEYSTRCIWRRLGKSRNRIYQLTVAEPVKFVLLAAYSQLEACKV